LEEVCTAAVLLVCYVLFEKYLARMTAYGNLVQLYEDHTVVQISIKTSEEITNYLIIYTKANSSKKKGK